MFVGFPVAFYPGVKFALANDKPVYKAIERDFRFIAPRAGEVNNGVANVMGNPAAL
jgi:hypothetical protein